MKVYTLLLGAVTFAAGCATVPKDAPEELHSAHAAIEKANHEGADEIVPKTMKQADRNLKDAVTAYKESQKGDGDTAQLDVAKRSANAAHKMADNAAALNADIRSWDGGDLEAYNSLKNGASNVADTDSGLSDTLAAQAPAMPTDMGMTQSVAFFPTSESDVSAAASPALDKLAAALKSNSSLNVTLIGYADRRGTEEFNDSLSQSRAENVADYLASQGIDRGRINVQAVGSKQASVADVEDEAALQLDRRVDVEFRAMAH